MPLQPSETIPQSVPSCWQVLGTHPLELELVAEVELVLAAVVELVLAAVVELVLAAVVVLVLEVVVELVLEVVPTSVDVVVVFAPPMLDDTEPPRPAPPRPPELAPLACVPLVLVPVSCTKVGMVEHAWAAANDPTTSPTAPTLGSKPRPDPIRRLEQGQALPQRPGQALHDDVRDHSGL
jgi:hypothetical protein